jgi:hypothetical protein
VTTTDRGARLRAVQAAGAAAALLAVPGSAAHAAAPPPPHHAALRAPIAGHATVAGQMRAAGREYEQRRLRRVAGELRHRVARAEGRRPKASATKERLAWQAKPASSVAASLQAIAACESGGNPRAIGGGGLYRGKYQFDYATWASVGGSGDPAAAPEAEQDMRAALLYERAGAAPWPVCGS